jgi:hypothetical protein
MCGCGFSRLSSKLTPALLSKPVYANWPVYPSLLQHQEEVIAIAIFFAAIAMSESLSSIAV